LACTHSLLIYSDIFRSQVLWFFWLFSFLQFWFFRWVVVRGRKCGRVSRHHFRL
jgi:hypothetical protein